MTDKQKHFLVGIVAGIVTLPLSYLIGTVNAALAVFAISSIVFIGKEITDKYDIDLYLYKHKATGFDKQDLLADYAGLFGGYVIAFMIKLVINVSNL